MIVVSVSVSSDVGVIICYFVLWLLLRWCLILLEGFYCSRCWCVMVMCQSVCSIVLLVSNVLQGRQVIWVDVCSNDCSVLCFILMQWVFSGVFLGMFSVLCSMLINGGVNYSVSIYVVYMDGCLVYSQLVISKVRVVIGIRFWCRLFSSLLCDSRLSWLCFYLDVGCGVYGNNQGNSCQLLWIQCVWCLVLVMQCLGQFLYRCMLLIRFVCVQQFFSRLWLRMLFLGRWFLSVCLKVLMLQMFLFMNEFLLNRFWQMFEIMCVYGLMLGLLLNILVKCEVCCLFRLVLMLGCRML